MITAHIIRRSRPTAKRELRSTLFGVPWLRPRLSKRLHRASTPHQHIPRQQFQARGLAAAVHGTQNPAKLISHWSVGFERQRAQFLAKVFHGTMHGDLSKVRLKLAVMPPMNSHRGMVFAATSRPAAPDGVASKVDRVLADISQPLPFRGEQRMFAPRRD